MNRPEGYQAFAGTWEYFSPGYQFTSSIGKVKGAIWQRIGDMEVWFAQQYNGDSRIYKFMTREWAELYVKAANEESRLKILEATQIEMKEMG